MFGQRGNTKERSRAPGMAGLGYLLLCLLAFRCFAATASSFSSRVVAVTCEVSPARNLLLLLMCSLVHVSVLIQ